MKAFISLLMLTIISGCQTMQQQMYSEQKALIDADAQAANSLCKKLGENLENSQEYILVSKKLAYDYNKITFKMRANKTKATEEDMTGIAAFAEAKDKCHKRILSGMRKFSPPLHPGYISIEETNNSMFMSAVIDLYNKTISYSEFYKKREHASLYRTEKNRELKAALIKSHQEARYLASRLAIDASKAISMRSQAHTAQQKAANAPLMDALSRSRNKPSITCTTIGITTTCN